MKQFPGCGAPNCSVLVTTYTEEGYANKTRNQGNINKQILGIFVVGPNKNKPMLLLRQFVASDCGHGNYACWKGFDLAIRYKILCYCLRFKPYRDSWEEKLRELLSEFRQDLRKSGKRARPEFDRTNINKIFNQ